MVNVDFARKRHKCLIYKALGRGSLYTTKGGDFVILTVLHFATPCFGLEKTGKKPFDFGMGVALYKGIRKRERESVMSYGYRRYRPFNVYRSMNGSSYRHRQTVTNKWTVWITYPDGRMGTFGTVGGLTESEAMAKIPQYVHDKGTVSLDRIVIEE